MIKNVTIDRDTAIRGIIEPNLVDLSYYARTHIPNYRTITEIPKEHMDYINSVKYAVNCEYMFSRCDSLTTLNLSNFGTSNVTNMSNMFSECRSLTTLDVSNWNTSNVTNMYNMFAFCELLTTLDVSNWNTSNVTNMSSMFYYCRSLTTLDVSNWNTSNVTNISGMFSTCRSLTTLDVSNFDTSNVTDMKRMFTYCRELTTIKGTLDLSSCEDVSFMFQYSPNIKGVHLKNVPRSLLNDDGSLINAYGELNKTYIIDNILEGK